MFEGIDLSKINLNDVMNQVQEMTEKSKEQNEATVFTSQAGGGMIELSINGNSDVIDLKIDDSLLEDKDSLQILLMSAISDVIKQSDNNKKNMAMHMMNAFSPFNKQ